MAQARSGICGSGAGLGPVYLKESEAEDGPLGRGAKLGYIDENRRGRAPIGQKKKGVHRKPPNRIFWESTLPDSGPEGFSPSTPTRLADGLGPMRLSYAGKAIRPKNSGPPFPPGWRDSALFIIISLEKVQPYFFQKSEKNLTRPSEPQHFSRCLLSGFQDASRTALTRQGKKWYI